MSNSKQLALATGNQKKLAEFKGLLEGYDIISIPVETKEIQGTSEEIIIEKAKQAYNILKRRCVVDDTSFCFDEWNGLPGPYIKDFIKHLGVEKLPFLTKNKRCEVKCFVALANSEEDILVFEGVISGHVVESKGDNGFFFDKVFIPDGHNLRFSEMSMEEKNKISHRFIAINKLKEYLDKEQEVF
jgi:inosine triphosphate pyrophosphatase